MHFAERDALHFHLDHIHLRRTRKGTSALILNLERTPAFCAAAHLADGERFDFASAG